jgi:hypothetical protein
MAKLVWTLLCRRAIVDENIKLVSLIDVVESFDFGAAPGAQVDNLPIEIAAVTLWTRDDPAKAEVTQERVRLVGPTGKEGQSVVAPVDLSNHRNYRNVVVYQGVPFSGSGEYAFIVELKTADGWAERGRMLLLINQVAPQSPVQ